MRQAVAALVAAQTLASKEEATSWNPALPDEKPALRVRPRRRMLWSAWLASVWKATHAGG